MFCCKCNQHVVNCTCPDIAERLASLAKSPRVYVGNVIAQRIRDGKNTRDEFPGDIHGPLGSEDAARKAPTLADLMPPEPPK